MDMNETLINFEDVLRYLKDKDLNEEYVLDEGLMMGFQRVKDFVKKETTLFTYPVCFDGVVILFIQKGNLRVDVNVSSYEVNEGSLLMLVPGNIVRLSLAEGASLSDIELYYLIISREFADGLSTYGRRSIQDRIKMYNNPCRYLSKEDREVTRDYFNLTRKIMTSGQKFKKEMVSGLVASLSFYSSTAKEPHAGASDLAVSSSRRNNQTFENFLNLVKDYHTRERGLTFYATQMSISRKYLGKVVRMASGRKASDWIDDFVIMEAKSMLKFSDKSIKEIVYSLNFVNQSVFYKYFKAHTGMTPSEYRGK